MQPAMHGRALVICGWQAMAQPIGVDRLHFDGPVLLSGEDPRGMGWMPADPDRLEQRGIVGEVVRDEHQHDDIGLARADERLEVAQLIELACP